MYLVDHMFLENLDLKMFIIETLQIYIFIGSFFYFYISFHGFYIGS